MPPPGTLLEPSLAEASFVRAALAHATPASPSSSSSRRCRLDGRDALSARRFHVRFGPTLGWVLVSLGGSGSAADAHPDDGALGRKSESQKRRERRTKQSQAPQPPPPRSRHGHGSVDDDDANAHAADGGGVTRVLCTTRAELVEPREERPYEGFVELRAEVQPMAGWQYERNRANEDEVLFERALDRAVRRSDVVDREALCVVAGQHVWSVMLHVHLLSSSGGNAVDCAVLASLLSLRHFRRPDVTVEGLGGGAAGGVAPRRPPRRKGAGALGVGDDGGARRRVVVHDAAERVPLPLALRHVPFSVTFAVFELPTSDVPGQQQWPGGAAPYAEMVGDGRAAVEGAADGQGDARLGSARRGGGPPLLLLLDPDATEERLASCRLRVVLNAQGEVCVLDKSGGTALPQATLTRAMAEARRRAKSLAAACDAALRRDEESRVVDVQ